MNNNPIIPGCNYHTTWQSNSSMRFVLKEINGTVATLYTRTTKNCFTTNVSDLIFINTDHNISKAERLTGNNYQHLQRT